jgi:hypothetical protein
MAFKSKTLFQVFDKNNTSVKDLEFNSFKAQTKSSLKKLAAVEGQETPFHLILDYFKDDKEKAVAHFFDLGNNIKLSKHFEQVEMKPGKLDKSMSSSPKEATTGVAYIETVDGKPTLHLKPDEKSKVQKGKWKKIIKALKPYLAGYSAVALLGEQEDEGESIQEELATAESTPTGKSRTLTPEQQNKISLNIDKMLADIDNIDKFLGPDDEDIA